MKPADYKKERNALVRAIKKQLKPFLWESGYCKRAFSKDKEPVMIWVPRNSLGEPTDKDYKLKGGFVITEFQGFTEDGVITDAFGGGLATADWEGIPIEDLYRLNVWMERKLPELTAYDQMQKSKASSGGKRSPRPLSAMQAAA